MQWLNEAKFLPFHGEIRGQYFFKAADPNKGGLRPYIMFGRERPPTPGSGTVSSLRSDVSNKPMVPTAATSPATNPSHPLRRHIDQPFHCQCSARDWSTIMIPRKGRRIVRVGDTDYAWRIRKKPTYLQGAFQSSMTLAIQACAADARSVLVVDLMVSRPDNWISPHQTAVKPSMVREMIAEALAAGWQPFSATKPFFYEYPLIRDRP